MEKVELSADKREITGKKVAKLRAQGLVPAVVYGKKLKPMNVVVNGKVFKKSILASEAGKNAIISLKIAESKAVPVLTHDIQFDPLTDEILHIDFAHVVMDELLRTKIPVELTGNPIGVKESGGVLVHGLRLIEVECLPGDIPDKYIIDVSGLHINQSLHVSDLKVDNKVKILAEPGEMIASCSPPTKVEETAKAPTPEEVAAATGAVPAEGGAEGAAAPKAEKGAKEAAPAAKPE